MITGHPNDRVLHAIGMLLYDASDPMFFENGLKTEERIEQLMACMRSIVRAIAELPVEN
jgi:hypothetical protein